MHSHFWVYIAISSLTVLLGCRSDQEASLEWEQHRIDRSISKDSAVKTTIAPYKAELDSMMDVRIGRSAEELEKGEPEGKLGNFVADLVLRKSKEWAAKNELPPPDLALLNNGGLRSSLPKGEVRKGRIYELMPFENVVEILELKGEEMEALFAYLAAQPQPIAGASLKIEEGNAIERRIGGESFDPEREYLVATSDFLADGGDGMDFFKGAEKRISTGIKVRNMIIERIRELDEEGQSVRAELDGRIRRADTEGEG